MFSKSNFFFSKEECEEYLLLLRLLFDYTKNYLTTEHMAKYVLDKTEHSEILKVLYLSGDLFPDYQMSILLHGFKSLLGDKCHDFPKVHYLYKNKDIDFKTYYGRGFTYTNLLENDVHNDEYDNQIEELIKNKYFDIVIYGSFHRETPFLEIVNKIINSSKTLLATVSNKNTVLIKSLNNKQTIYIIDLTTAAKNSIKRKKYKTML